MTLTTQVVERDSAGGGSGPGVAVLRRALGFEVRSDFEFAPGVRLVEVVPPGTEVGIVLLPGDTPLPIAVRMETPDAEAAFEQVRSAGASLHNDAVLRMNGAPPMFFFSDPDGNGLVYMQTSSADTDDVS